MYKKIVVPLDGSKLAECILPYVEGLAKGCGTEEVILVSVTERIVGRTRAPEIREKGYSLSSDVWPPEGEVSMYMGKKTSQAYRYLHKIAKGLEGKGVKVQTQVLYGKPAEKIASFAEEIGADLIALASHGRSGPSRWAYGSVAEKVFRAGCVAILMVRAPGCIVGF